MSSNIIMRKGEMGSSKAALCPDQWFPNCLHFGISWDRQTLPMPDTHPRTFSYNWVWSMTWALRFFKSFPSESTVQ